MKGKLVFEFVPSPLDLEQGEERSPGKKSGEESRETYRGIQVTETWVRSWKVYSFPFILAFNGSVREERLFFENEWTLSGI